MHQPFQRQIQGHRLTILQTPAKLIIRALSKQTSALLICQFINGQLRQDLKHQFENEDILFDELISPATALRIQKEELIIPYTTFRRNRPVQREFIIPLTKVEGNQIETLKNKVARLEEQAQKFALIEQQVRVYKSIIDNLELRSDIFYYREGVLKNLMLDQANNQQYQIRQNYLRRKDQKDQRSFYNQYKTNISLISLVSNQPLDFETKLISYKVFVHDTIQTEQTSVFIGLCKLKEQVNVFMNQAPEKFQFIVPQVNKDPRLDHSLLLSKNTKTTLCDLFYANKIRKHVLKKGDVFVLTVDLENYHMTWYKNQVSLQRSYFQRPTTNIYPFIWMTPSTQVIF